MCLNIDLASDLASAAPLLLLLKSFSSIPYDISRELFSLVFQHFSGKFLLRYSVVSVYARRWLYSDVLLADVISC